MKLSINSSPFVEVNKEHVEQLFKDILSEFDIIHSISISIERKDDHLRRELQDANKPIDPNDPRFINLIGKSH